MARDLLDFVRADAGDWLRHLLAHAARRASQEFTCATFDLLRRLAVWCATTPTCGESAAIGALLFASFSVFWTTLVFFLARPPYHYGARTAGAMGLLAAASAALAPLVGRMIDRRSPRLGIAIAVCMTMAAFA